jgi:TPR repeat protein
VVQPCGTRLTLRPTRSSQPHVQLELTAQWEADGAQRSTGRLSLDFPGRLDVRSAAQDIAVELSTQEHGAAPDGGGPVSFWLQIQAPRPVGEAADAWVAARDTIGFGDVEGGAPSAADDLLATPGRVGGPHFSGTLRLRFTDVSRNVPVGAPPLRVADHLSAPQTRWYLPVRVGLSISTDRGARDWGRSLYGFAIYGTNTEPIPETVPDDLRVGQPSAAAPARIADVSAESIDPDDPTVVPLIEHWLSVAEPPENATELHQLYYDAWGRKTGMTYAGATVEHPLEPPDRSGASPAAYTWSRRRELDSVDHCTLEEFVLARLADGSTRDCRDRYARLATARVPDLAGRHRDQARVELEVLGFAVRLESAGQAPSEAQAWTVAKISPRPDTECKAGSEVTLTAYDEYVPPPVALIDVRGQSRADAEAALKDAGFSVRVEQGQPAPSRDKSGSVLSQNPEPETMIPPGSRVTLSVYAPYQPPLRERAEAGDANAQFQLARCYAEGSGFARDDALALEWYRRAAEQGHANAQFQVGYAYQHARGVRADYATALQWYRKAAAQNVAAATNNLGVMYEAGQGVTQDYAEAHKLYQRAFEQGDPYGASNLGKLYHYGRGVQRDYAKAAEWYRKVGDNGPPPAYTGLGQLYENGLGVERDRTTAAQWYRKAATAGDAAAQTALGELYRLGRGVGQDHAEALKWYAQAAEQGDLEAMFQLGDLYHFGRGVPTDYDQSSRWYAEAAGGGHALAQLRLAYCYNSGWGVAKNVQTANQWLRRSADTGLAEAQYRLGLCYEQGHGLTRDLLAAYGWLRKAADQGHADSQNRLGEYFENGWGVKPDEKQAVEWYRKAAQQNSSPGQVNLGRMYEQGDGVRRDYQQANEWYRKAAERNNPDAQFRIGGLHYNGRGVKKDYAEALKWYRKAAERQHAGALFSIGYLYAKGRGVEKNYLTAAQWYRKAAERGHPAAARRLGDLYDDGKGVAENEAEAIRWWRRAARAGDQDAQEELQDRGLGW